jgi:micrococcal nuclease
LIFEFPLNDFILCGRRVTDNGLNASPILHAHRHKHLPILLGMPRQIAVSELAMLCGRPRHFMGQVMLLALAVLWCAVPMAARAARDTSAEVAVQDAEGAASASVTWVGWVSWVIDGDTVVLIRSGQSAPVKLRIEGIDAPETCQTGGSESRDALIRLVLRKPVEVLDHGQDVYGRHIGKLSMDGNDLGAEMVRTGHAWAYRFRTGSGPYARLQREAQSHKSGMFAHGQATVSPSSFRKFHGPCSGG